MWFSRAAELGHATAARALGLLHLTGAGVARDPHEAASWFRRSAEAGDKASQSEPRQPAAEGCWHRGGPRPRPRVDSRPRPIAVTWWRRSTLACAWPRALASNATNDGPRNGCARRPMAWSARNIGTAACSPKGAESSRTRPRAVPGSPAPQMPDCWMPAWRWPRFAGQRPQRHARSCGGFDVVRAGGQGAPIPAPCSRSARCMAAATTSRPTGWWRKRWFRQAAERGHGYAQMMLGRYLARKPGR